MSFIRTVLGDIKPSDLGVCYAHEHIIIGPSVATLKYPEFLLDSVDKAAEELRRFYADGGRAMVDSMPCDAGRDVLKLAEISRRTRVHIVCPTGIHLAKYYDAGHWSLKIAEEELAELFVREIEQGIDTRDYGSPLARRSGHRAGLIKVASGMNSLSAHERKIFAAASAAHRATGCPILTHCEAGTAAMEQIAAFEKGGVDLRHVVLSHTDRKPDPGYHREILSTGVRVEYDSAFRWKPGQGNPTLDLLVALLPEFPDQIMLGMDAARSAYWKSYGGQPGLSFLLNDFAPAMHERGISEDQVCKIFVNTPAEAYAFVSR